MKHVTWSEKYIATDSTCITNRRLIKRFFNPLNAAVLPVRGLLARSDIVSNGLSVQSVNYAILFLLLIFLHISNCYCFFNKWLMFTLTGILHIHSYKEFSFCEKDVMFNKKPIFLYSWALISDEKDGPFKRECFNLWIWNELVWFFRKPHSKSAIWFQSTVLSGV